MFHIRYTDDLGRLTTLEVTGELTTNEVAGRAFELYHNQRRPMPVIVSWICPHEQACDSRQDCGDCGMNWHQLNFIICPAQ